MELSESWVQTIIDRESKDVELVALQLAGERRRRIVRLFIDRTGGVDHEVCARVSSWVGAALDAEGVFDGSYVLEVSSPGVERPLTKPRHFESQVGRKVWVKTRQAVGGRQVWQGLLTSVSADGVVVNDGSQESRITFGDIAEAHLVFEFERGRRG